MAQQNEDFTRPFAWWIFGYQKFYEPLIRKCICLDRGWEDITEEARPPELEELRSDLRHWKCGNKLVANKLKKEAIAGAKRRKRKIVLDAAFKTKTGAEKASCIVGEFKSWGGYSLFGQSDFDKLQEGCFIDADRLCIRKLYHSNQEPLTVNRFLLAITDFKAGFPPPKPIQFPRLTIEIVSINKLLESRGKEAARARPDIIDSFRSAVDMVNRYLSTGLMK